MPGFLQPLFTFSYWFQSPGAPFTPIFGRVILIVMALLFLAVIDLALIRRFYVKDKEVRQALGKAQVMALTLSLIGFAIYGATYEGIPFFSMRLWFIVWAVVFAYWGYRLFIQFTKVIPSLKALQSERAAYEKWLPKPGKK